MRYTGGSTGADRPRGHGLTVEWLPSKQQVAVRFRVPAPNSHSQPSRFHVPRLSFRSLFAAACMAAVVGNTSAVLAKGTSTLPAVVSVAPKTVGVGNSVVVSGSHLRAKTYLTFLLVIPNAKKPQFERFIGLNKTDSRGSFRTTIRLPREQFCGPAAVLAYNTHSQKPVTANITLIGCKASGKPAPLPPPPGTKPPKKGKP
jgi:hypothetical protein